MKMDEHARAWGHEFVAGVLNSSALPAEQRNSLHWEIVSHLHEKAERRVESRGGSWITLADLQAVVTEMGGRDGVAAAFLQTRVVATPRAGFPKRLAAFALDVFIAVVVGAFLAGFVFEPFEMMFGYRGGMWDFFPILVFGSWFGYNVIAELRYGTTIGKTVLKLRTVMEDGRPITTSAAVIRNIAKAFPPLLLLDALLYLIAFVKDDQRLSDRLANTIVIDTTKSAWTPPPAPMPPASTPPFTGTSKTFIPVEDPPATGPKSPGGPPT